MSRNLKIAQAIDDAQVVSEAPRSRHHARPSAKTNPWPQHRLGEILVASGVLANQDVQSILSQQAHNPVRFGEIAVGLGLVAQSDIDLALEKQADIEFPPDDGVDVAASPANLQALHARQVEVLRSVRSQLLLRWFGDTPEQHTLAVMSHAGGDGRSHVCAHLGRLFAQAQEDTLLIDTHFGNAKLHEYFGLSNKTGLCTYLRKQTARAPIRAVPDCPNLHVLTAGPSTADDMALLERQPFARLLSMLAQRYSVILLDTPPAGLRSEAVTVAVRSSGCLLVMRRNAARMADVQRLNQRLAQHGVEVVGALVNEG